MISLSQKTTSRKPRIHLANTERPTHYYSELDYLIHTLSIVGYEVIVFPDDIAIFQDGILVDIIQRGDQRENR